MTPYESFIMYTALKLHFNQEKYDYHQYNGKIRISKESFEKRKDKYDFVKLVRKYSDDEMENFFISNFLRNPKVWTKDLLQEDSHDCFIERQKILQSLTYIFRNDLDRLKQESSNLNDVMKPKEGDYPLLLTRTFQKDVHLETFVIMDSILNFCSVWNRKITDTFLWPNFYMLCKKYRPFLKVDLSKFRNILREGVTLS